MNRTQFVTSVLATGAAQQAAVSKKESVRLNEREVHWTVRGLYCETCAVGLETVLSQEPAHQSTVTAPRSRIEQCGFHVAKKLSR